MNHTTPHIVILGAGFAALKAARELRKARSVISDIKGESEQGRR